MHKRELFQMEEFVKHARKIKTRCFVTEMTRFYNAILKGLKKRAGYSQNAFLCTMCSSLFGFLSGSLFGTLLEQIRHFLMWDGFIIASLLIFVEAISYISYKGDKGDDKASYVKNKAIEASSISLFLRSIKSFKIGVMIGFFVDAFKVGS